MSTMTRTSSKARFATAGALIIAAGLSTACNNAGEGALSGAGVGAVAGLIIGSTVGDPGAGAAIGAAIGGAGGAVIGDQNERNARRHYDPHPPRRHHTAPGYEYEEREYRRDSSRGSYYEYEEREYRRTYPR